MVKIFINYHPLYPHQFNKQLRLRFGENLDPTLYITTYELFVLEKFKVVKFNQ